VFFANAPRPQGYRGRFAQNMRFQLAESFRPVVAGFDRPLTTQRGIDINNGEKRLLSWLKDTASNVDDGRIFKSMTYWDRVVTETLDSDGIHSLQSFSVSSYYLVTFTREGNCISIKGDVQHLIWDYYDFNRNSEIPLLGAGWIDIDDLVALEYENWAANFFAYSWLHQTFSCTCNKKGKNQKLEFSDVMEDWGTSNAYLSNSNLFSS
jgi:hypothetical protein